MRCFGTAIAWLVCIYGGVICSMADLGLHYQRGVLGTLFMDGSMDGCDIFFTDTDGIRRTVGWDHGRVGIVGMIMDGAGCMGSWTGEKRGYTLVSFGRRSVFAVSCVDFEDMQIDCCSTVEYAVDIKCNVS